MNRLIESLDYGDMTDHVVPEISIDEYKAKMGPDHEIITLSFIVDSKLVGEDLVAWFEKGYDFVLDASVSTGEIAPRKYIVFVELERRSKASARIIELLTDLRTLTDLKVDEWAIKIDNKKHPASEETIKQYIILNPNRYKEENGPDEEFMEAQDKQALANMLNAATIPTTGDTKNKLDPELENFVNLSRG